jgi:predicted transcriptional regulator
MIEDLPREDILATVDCLVEEMLQSAGLTAPPIDAIALARGHLGISVYLDRSQSQRGRAQRSAGRKQIFLRPEPTEERHQWTVAHEIGEHLKTGLLERLGIAPAETRTMLGESLANLFAYHLLVPSCWFATDAPQLAYDLLELKKRYQTASHEVIGWRFLDLPDPCIVTVVDNGHIHRRRSNAWTIRRCLEPAEEACQRYVHYYSRPRMVQTDDWTVHGWPVHQADWKREILRSVIDPAAH